MFRWRVIRCEILKTKTVYVVWPSCPLSLPSRSPAPAPQVALLASNFQDWGVRLYLFLENITKWDVTLVKVEKLCCSFHTYTGCYSTIDRGFVRKETPNANTPKLLHLGMGMIRRHTPPPPCTALLTHVHKLRRVEGKEGTLVPHRLQAVKQLHHAKHVLNGADREHTCDLLGAYTILARVQLKKTYHCL